MLNKNGTPHKNIHLSTAPTQSCLEELRGNAEDEKVPLKDQAQQRKDGETREPLQERQEVSEGPEHREVSSKLQGKKRIDLEFYTQPNYQTGGRVTNRQI